MARLIFQAAAASIAAAAAVVLQSAAVGAPQPSLAKDPTEKPEDFPAGPARDDTFYRCTACHGFKIVAAQGMSRARWDETISWMSDRHNMPKLEGREREAILDYLAATYPEKAKPRGGWQNPFSK